MPASPGSASPGSASPGSARPGSASPGFEPCVAWRASGVGHAAEGSEAVSAALRSVSSDSCCDGGGSGDSCMHGAPCLTSCGRWSDDGAAESCSPAAPAAASRRHVRVECMVLQREAVAAQVRGVCGGCGACGARGGSLRPMVRACCVCPDSSCFSPLGRQVANPRGLFVIPCLVISRVSAASLSSEAANISEQ